MTPSKKCRHTLEIWLRNKIAEIVVKLREGKIVIITTQISNKNNHAFKTRWSACFWLVKNNQKKIVLENRKN